MPEVAIQQQQQVGGGGDAPQVAQGDGEQQPRQQTWWEIVSGTLTRLAFMWMLMSWLKGGNNNQQQQDGTAPATTAAAGRNLFAFGERLSLWVYVNEIESFTSKSSFSQRDLFWKLDDIEFGSWTGGSNNDGSFGYEGKIKLSDRVKNNGSLYLHAFLTKPYHIPFRTAETLPDELYDAEYTVYRSKRLNRYKKRTIKNTKNLLTGETATDKALLERAEKYGNVEIISHWHPNVTINLVNDQTPWKRGMVPEPMTQVVNFDESGLRYEPIVYVNDYWNLMRDHLPINDTVDEVDLNVAFAPLSLFKLQMYVTQTSQKQQWFNMMSNQEQSDEEQDALKEAILDTNPYMLALTAVVSIVHSIFEFLAFKNDIQFWKTRDSLAGLSVRSILTNIVQSLIVFLYVLDNDTSFVIKISLFVGVLIDAWKITKVVNVKVDREKLMFGFLPTISMEDKSTYVESETKKYDDLAFKYLGWLLFPLLVAYCIYSLMYEEHKGVYSFVLSIAYGFLLTFGFIMMTPQLFINYKLKSVAHLPWRMLTYKALNTFVDDIFAFVIKMPTLYRIGCFRDDLVFFVFLYQRYKYRVDPTRVNEFGTTGEQVDKSPDQPLAITDDAQTPQEVGDKKND